MSRSISGLINTVRAIRPFVPAKDFETSKRFYADIGFHVEPLGDELAAVHLGPHSFLLQNYYVEDWAGNFMMHMMVNDLDAWWEHLTALNLASRYGVKSPRAPKLESWGLNVTYLTDPAGVLWHIAAVPAKTAI